MTPDASIAAEVAAVRNDVGIWLRTDHTFVRITGADAAAWLQSQTTNDVVALESGAGHANAALDRQGRLQGFFTLHRWQDEYWMLVDRAQWPHLHDHLDSHLFIEDAQMEEAGDEVEQVVVQGPGAVAFLARAVGDFQIAAQTLPAAPYRCGPVDLLGFEALAFRITLTGEDGFILVTERGQGRALVDALLQSEGDIRDISPTAQDILRIEAGLPRWNADVDTTHIISETTLDHEAVSYTKGCYLGQEVVARLKTYGSPKRVLMGLVLQEDSPNRGTGFQPVRRARPSPEYTSLGSPDAPDIRQGAYLPHWTESGAIYFVTFRLADSLPKVTRERLRLTDRASRQAYWDEELDKSKGACYLKQPKVAQLVNDALKHFDGERYHLIAWCVMPNHVHAVFQPMPGHALDKILHSWKSYTAVESNKVLNRRGRFWQEEYYDHLIRNEDELRRCIDYVEENPAEAGLVDWPWCGVNEETLNDILAPASTPHGLEARATNLMINGKIAGRFTSTCFSPTLNAHIALAYLARDYRTPGRLLEFETETGQTLCAEVRVLPFIEPEDAPARARDLYDEALKRFEVDLADTDASAIPLLEEAILHDPTFEDAYEVLGVVLHRHGRLEEAIAVMETLVRINPDCQMAHTNLSVFYVAQGRIEDAEEEKAKAAVLAIKRASDERQAKEMAESERRRLEAEALERIGMFQEVLEIDPDDPLATFGLGKSYIQINQHAEAIPYFQRSTQLQKDYSVAWLNLGQCHETVGNVSEAVAAYRAGIEAATRKGDLMPLREMERRLKSLQAQAVR